jgi:hypothetical protein
MPTDRSQRASDRSVWACWLTTDDEQVCVQVVLEEVLQRLPPPPDDLALREANCAVLKRAPATRRPDLVVLPRDRACAQPNQHTGKCSVGCGPASKCSTVD